MSHPSSTTDDHRSTTTPPTDSIAASPAVAAALLDEPPLAIDSTSNSTPAASISFAAAAPTTTKRRDEEEEEEEEKSEGEGHENPNKFGTTTSMKEVDNTAAENLSSSVASTPIESANETTSATEPTNGNVSSESTSVELIHANHTCSGCGQKPIVGLRYHCLTEGCNYDLCHPCQMKQPHPTTETHTYEHVLSEGLDGHSYVPVKARTPWVSLLENTIDLIQWLLSLEEPFVDEQSKATLQSLLGDFQFGQVGLTEDEATGGFEMNVMVRAMLTEKVTSVLAKYSPRGHAQCMQLLHPPEDQLISAADVECVMIYSKCLRLYFETLAGLVESATQRLEKQHQLVAADHATLAAAKAAGLTLKADEYDPVATEKKVLLYCEMQYELVCYLRMYDLLIQLLHQYPGQGTAYEFGFDIMKDTFESWIRLCLLIIRAKDCYCLKIRQLCNITLSDIFRPGHDQAIQFLYRGHEQPNSLIKAVLSTVFILSAHDGAIGGAERPGLCDRICSSSTFGHVVAPDLEAADSSNGRVGLSILRYLFRNKIHSATGADYSPIIPIIHAFCMTNFELVKNEPVASQLPLPLGVDHIPIQRQLTGQISSNGFGRLEILALVTMQGSIIGGYDSQYYVEDPTRMIPVFTHLLRIIENPAMEPTIRAQVAFVLSTTFKQLPNESASLIYERYHLLYPSDTTIPNEKRLPVIHRLMATEELFINDPMEKCYPPLEQFRIRLQWTIARCARLMSMKELLRHVAPTSTPIASSNEEQKESISVGQTSALTSPFVANGEPRNILVWLMDMLELFMSNDLRIRSDGRPNPRTPDATSDVWGDRWQLHSYDYQMVEGLIVTIRHLIDATPGAYDRLNNETARRYWSPFLPRLFPLLLSIQELLPPHRTSTSQLKGIGLCLIDDLIRFIPQTLLLDQNDWIRLHRISDHILTTPLTPASKAEEDASFELEESIQIGRQQVYERCQQASRWIPYELEIEVIKHQQQQQHQKKKKDDWVIDFRRVYAESVHELRADMLRAHDRILDHFGTDYGASLKGKLLSHLLRVLPLTYGTLPKTEEDELLATELKGEEQKKTKATESAKVSKAGSGENVNEVDGAAAAAGGEVNEVEMGEQPEGDDDGDDEEEKEGAVDAGAVRNIHASPGVDEERSQVMFLIGDICAQAPFTSPAGHEEVNQFYDTIWSQIIANYSAYGKLTTKPLALLMKYLPLIKPMPLEQKWRPGEASILPTKLQQQLTENMDLGIELFKSSTDIRVIQNVLVGWGELLKGYGLSALGVGEDINRRETYLISFALFIIRFSHPCQHTDDDVPQSVVFDADWWQVGMSQVDGDGEASQLASGLAQARSQIAESFHTKVHTHGAACTEWTCYHDELVELNHRCCEFLAHLARARGSSYETRHKRIWKHLSYAGEGVPWRGALGCYWSGVAESLGSEGFDTYKVDVFEYMLTNLTIKESQGLFLSQSAYCLGHIFMHIDLARIQSYLTRTLDAILQAHGYAQRKLDAHHKALSEGTRVGLCTNGAELQSWFQCQDGITIALGKILMVASSHLAVSSRMDELLKLFLSELPLKVLIDDQKVVYSAVIKLINTFPQQHPGVVEPYYPRILFIFATVLDLNLGKHRILPQLEKFILMGASTILKQQPQLRQTVLVDEWSEKEAGLFGQRFLARVDGKSITSATPAALY